MAKNSPKTVFVCSECGFEHIKWQGKCRECGAWDTLEEQVIAPATSKNSFNNSSVYVSDSKMQKIYKAQLKRLKKHNVIQM